MNRTAMAFRAIKTEPLDEFLTTRHDEITNFEYAIEKFEREIDGRTLAILAHVDEGASVHSYVMKSSRDLLPGWRRLGAGMNAVLDRMTPEGDELAARVAEIKLDSPTVPGCPKQLHGDMLTVYPRVEKFGADYFLLVNQPIGDESLALIDTTIWAAVPMSEYFDARKGSKLVAV